jgi:hypothetical protein
MAKTPKTFHTNKRFEVRDEHGKLVPKRSFPNEELRTGSVIGRNAIPNPWESLGESIE